MPAIPSTYTSTRIDTIRGTSDWDAVIIGAGPASYLQYEYLKEAYGSNLHTLVIAEEIGGSLGRLGDIPLQSFTHELDVHGPVPLRDMVGKTKLHPTGAEYRDYISQMFYLENAPLLRATVTDVDFQNDRFLIRLLTSDDEKTQVISSRTVILATGTTPRPLPPQDFSDSVHTHAHTVQTDIQLGHYGPYEGTTVVVIGSGNTALQTAVLLAPVAKSILVLARQYRGVWPFETHDRYAWRHASTPLHELVVRSAQTCMAESSHLSQGPCVRLLIYEELRMTEANQVITYRKSANTSVASEASLPYHHHHAQVLDERGDVISEQLDGRCRTMTIWAHGMRPIYPPGIARSLATNAAGYVLHDVNGESSFPGLYVIGACAGMRSVNEMHPVDISARFPVPAIH